MAAAYLVDYYSGSDSLQNADKSNSAAIPVNSSSNPSLNVEQPSLYLEGAQTSIVPAKEVQHTLQAEIQSPQVRNTKKTRIRHGDGSGGGEGGRARECKSRNAKQLEAAASADVDEEMDLDNALGDMSGSCRERYHVDGPAMTLLLGLAAACDSILKPTSLSKHILSNVLSMLSLLKEEKSWVSKHRNIDNSLEAVFLCVEHSNTLISYAYLLHIFNLIHLRTKLEDLKRAPSHSKKRNISLMDIMKRELGDFEGTNEYRKRYRYVADGAIFSILASSGSIYILLVVAAAHLRANITKTPVSDIINLARAIRDPDPDTDAGKAILYSIIPAMAYLRNKVDFDFDFSSIFSPYMCRNQLNPVNIKASDLKKSDDFFDSISFNCFIKPRNWQSWCACSIQIDNAQTQESLESSTILFNQISNLSIQELSSTSLTESLFDGPLTPLPSDESDDEIPCHIKIISVATNFDLLKSENKNFPIQHKSNSNLRQLFTEQERDKALNSLNPGSIGLFKQKLQNSLSTGVKKKDYIRLKRNLMNNKVLRIDDKNKNPLIVVSTNMPQSIKFQLLDRLKAIFPKDFQYTDTKLDSDKYSFLARHYTTYNRYGIQAIGANFEEEPHQYSRPNVPQTHSTNMFIPRSSNELRMDLERYNQLQEAFADLFEWQRQELRRILPEEYELLRQWIDVLPGNQSTPVYPFGGFVVNLNVATRAHRDDKDFLRLCLIIVISDCKGGELALVEPGVVLELQSGDMVLFRSADLTHFNLDFEGFRASIVMHSDGAAQSWIDNRNGWVKSRYFK